MDASTAVRWGTMDHPGFADTAATLSTAAWIVQTPPPEILGRLSELLSGSIPHLAAAQLSSQCAGTPLTSLGQERLAEEITGADVAPLLGQVTAGQPWQGRFRIGGADHPVLAVASDHAPRGSILLFVLPDDSAVDPEAAALTQSLWDLATAAMYMVTLESEPTILAQSRAVAAARANALAELSEAHAAALGSLLGVLRSGRMDDAAARAMAVDLALNALIDLRTDSRRDRADAGEEPVGRAFQRLADSLKSLLRHSSVQLELDAPGNDQLAPAVVAHAARVAVRAVVLAMLRQDEILRIRVGWRIVGSALQAIIRDDGPGVLSDDLDLGLIAERLRAQSGHLDVDAVPGWGLTVKVELPIEVAKPSGPEPLASLGGRELEVLGRLAQGHRNRVIADDLHISESTVKFHVTNILTKLEVSSRGEAAAVFHAAAV